MTASFAHIQGIQEAVEALQGCSYRGECSIRDVSMQAGLAMSEAKALEQAQAAEAQV